MPGIRRSETLKRLVPSNEDFPPMSSGVHNWIALTEPPDAYE